MDPKDIVRAGYDKVSYAYRGEGNDPASPDFEQYGTWLRELLELLPAGAPVLDLGCGNGIPVARLLSEAGCQVSGVDLSQVQIERAKRLVPKAHFTRADMSAVKFPPASFAAVVSFYAIIHLPLEEQPALFDNIFTWLRPGGFLMVTTGAQAWTGTEEDWLGVEGARMYWSHADAQTYRQLLTDCGFSIHWMRFVPEGSGGHTLILARRPD